MLRGPRQEGGDLHWWEGICAKRKHYEDECYHKQRLLVKLNSEAQSGGGSAGGRSQGGNGKCRSQGAGKGQGPAQGKGGGFGGPDKKNKDKNKDKNQDRSGGTPTLRQGGPILSTLVGSKTRGLRPVLRRKLKKNKGLSVRRKMGTSLTPANVPASCGWPEKCARRSLT